MYHRLRGRTGTWTPWSGLAGYGGAATFTGTALAITGRPDGTAHVAAIGAA
ncbi:hypothetical protein [Streptomyces yangpuensis]|uniref:hypothetical protein n=1 Tax=Streptomyces yangpuensis TaxID=1648182 RepID=UPI003715D0B7